MTHDEIQEEAGILALASSQIGQQLVTGQLNAVIGAYRRLGTIVRKLEALEKAMNETSSPAASPAAPEVLQL
jgi:hypothetical protein